MDFLRQFEKKEIVFIINDRIISDKVIEKIIRKIKSKTKVGLDMKNVKTLNSKLFTQCLIGDIQPAEVVDVLIDRELVEHGDVLHDDADILFDIVADGGHLFAEELDIALIVGQEGEEAVDSGGLAGAVWTEQTEYLALFYLEAEVVERDELAVAFNEVFYFYDSVFHDVTPFGL